jgi:hypothetical protein
MPFEMERDVNQADRDWNLDMRSNYFGGCGAPGFDNSSRLLRLNPLVAMCARSSWLKASGRTVPAA